MIEQQVKKATACKGKEADVHMIDKTPKGLRGVNSAYAASTAYPISNRFSQPRHLIEHSIRGEGLINPDIPRGSHKNSLHYPCPW